MIAARTDFIQQNKKILRAILSAVQEAAKLFHNNKDYSIEIVSKSYNLSKGDSEKWNNSVRYSLDGAISQKALKDILRTLLEAKTIRQTADLSDLTSQGFVTIA
jgi:ABC-type nitrate/sulfonate/bicarbonate transport system substrate-binding protein